ncbi:MAG: tRNA (N6-isopentenyl adenosine(37)-C2)-methylthiotransferase MiaB [Flavobacteriales bacterium]|nr:tRNA (N6-isopentenyl adenosine(37)-C2)-methylthiotransferase MiaB [Flavobacteriales bacterium]
METELLEQPGLKKDLTTRTIYIESYGCAMNFADSEVVATILGEKGYSHTPSEEDADIILINTCSIRENAEQKIRHRLNHLRSNKKRNHKLIIGILGCMAERLKKNLLEEEKLVDLVAGPDSYRDLPKLLAEVEDGQKSINVLLSLEETYAEINPTRLNSNGVTAFVSIMRGCDNMCSFCVVPFTRGRERSRDAMSIVEEVRQLATLGYKEVTLLGQNVDSYLWFGGGPKKEFSKLTVEEQVNSINFAKLLGMVAEVDEKMRIRFSTSHPKDITDEVLYTMIRYPNICNYIHLPAQSGSTRILDLMNRNYTREWYLNKVERIRELIPECGISCDIISGFCSETEEEHQETLSLMEICEFDFSYMYNYSERPGTLAARKLKDDIPLEVKSRRLQEIIALQNRVSKQKNASRVGSVVRVLTESVSKKSNEEFKGRSDDNITVIFPADGVQPGDYVDVLIERSTTTSLIGKVINKTDKP